MGHLLYPSLSNALTGEQPLVIPLPPQQFGSNMHRWMVGCVWWTIVLKNKQIYETQKVLVALKSPVKLK